MVRAGYQSYLHRTPIERLGCFANRHRDDFLECAEQQSRCALAGPAGRPRRHTAQGPAPPRQGTEKACVSTIAGAGRPGSFT